MVAEAAAAVPALAPRATIAPAWGAEERTDASAREERSITRAAQVRLEAAIRVAWERAGEKRERERSERRWVCLFCVEDKRRPSCVLRKFGSFQLPLARGIFARKTDPSPLPIPSVIGQSKRIV
jgi:hypothetical protein